jgi:hypothetical protein
LPGRLRAIQTRRDRNQRNVRLRALLMSTVARPVVAGSGLNHTLSNPYKHKGGAYGGV